MKRKLTKSMISHLEWINSCYQDPNDKCVKIYENGIKNTYQTTISEKEDGKTFVITGDIPAMWLRDSAAQVRPLLLFVKEDEAIKKLVKGVIRQQFEQILIDPYANAFNDGPTAKGHQEDDTEMKPEVWEKKYETDSLCYPIQLAYLYWKITNDDTVLDEVFHKVCQAIIHVFKTEQEHFKRSSYVFQRVEDEEERIIYETLPNGGKGHPLAYTGMTWCGFRPSDDACQKGYLIPSNMFAVVILNYMHEMLNYNEERVKGSDQLGKEALSLAKSIDAGIQAHGIVEHETYGKVYAYEVDGYGHYLLMDDANVPSLLSLPYIGYCNKEDAIYQNTRKMLLSQENPYYYEGKVGKGIGSPHTPKDHIWPIALAIQGLTANSDEEKRNILEMLVNLDADTYLMHEGVHVDNPFVYTRPWFSWANAMFSEFVMSIQGRWIPHTPLWKAEN